MKFCLYDSDTLKDNEEPLLVQSLPFVLEWIRPVKVKYIESSKETSSLINHLYYCHSDNFNNSLKKKITPSKVTYGLLVLEFQCIW